MSLTASEIDVTVGITVGGVTYNCSPTNPASTNTGNLQHLLNLLVSSRGPTNGSGGTLIFPSVGTPGGPNASYSFAGSVTVGVDGGGATQPYSIIIKGDGQQQASSPLLVQTAADDLFVVNTNDGTDDDDVGGVAFQDLLIAYAPETPTAGNSAIRVTNKSEATRLFRVSLFNWPVAVNFNSSAKCSMINCSIITNSSNIPTTAVQIGDARWGSLSLMVSCSERLLEAASQAARFRVTTQAPVA